MPATSDVWLYHTARKRTTNTTTTRTLHMASRIYLSISRAPTTSAISVMCHDDEMKLHKLHSAKQLRPSVGTMDPGEQRWGEGVMFWCWWCVVVINRRSQMRLAESTVHTRTGCLEADMYCSEHISFTAHGIIKRECYSLESAYKVCRAASIADQSGDALTALHSCIDEFGKHLEQAGTGFGWRGTVRSPSSVLWSEVLEFEFHAGFASHPQGLPW